MEIIYNNFAVYKNFSSLEIGSLFLDVDVVDKKGPVYMKIETVFEENGCKNNAIRIDDGILMHFYPSHKVIELEGKLTIKRKEN